MNVGRPGWPVPAIAAGIAEPARARMLYSLLDGRARTATELAAVAGVSPSTASVHLRRLIVRRLIAVRPQGRHRYYSLHGAEVAAVLEALNVLAGGHSSGFVPITPRHLWLARSCYDHLAGRVGVAVHDRVLELGWLVETPGNADETTPAGL